MFPTLPISYCTNVHPGLTLAEVTDGLRTYTGPLNEAVGPIAAGLWLAESVVDELLKTAAAGQLRATLKELGLVCYTLNAFPQGNFHSERVKEDVYRPNWATDERLAYTKQCAAVLAELMPEGVEGSLSTVPLGFKLDNVDRGRCIDRLIEFALYLDDLHDETGSVVRLAIEPEPCCELETTAETIQFFNELREVAAQQGAVEVVERHIGVCYDVCHQSVEFEDVVASIRSLQAANVRIVKLHISCAIESDPADVTQMETLATFAEPRYLHQTFASHADGHIGHVTDLTAEVCKKPPEGLAGAKVWRTHFHVPVNAESVGPLSTTRRDLRRALAAVHRLPYSPHLEIETYTWAVLPGQSQVSLVDGLAAEVSATRELLAEAQRPEQAPSGTVVSLG